MIDRTQNFLALDLEMNQPSDKLIQVGIAIGNIMQDPKDYIVKKWYIHPNENISQYIIDLTGITDRDISLYSQSAQSIANELGALIDQYQTWMNPVTWGGGDSHALLQYFRNEGVDFPYFGRRWIDVKTWFTMLMVSTGREPKGGLSSAMGKFKLPFTGQAHRADVDAANTLKFYFRLLERQRLMELIIKDAKGVV